VLKACDGFQGHMSLIGEDSSRSKATILWASNDAADAAEETLAERRKGMVAQVGISIESVDLYEAPVVELEGAKV